MRGRQYEKNAGKCFEMEGDARGLSAVLMERFRQEDKWGRQDHDMQWYVAILMEEVGEFSRAILATHFGHGDQQGFEEILKEATHTAAVSLAIVECLIRNGYNCISVLDKPSAVSRRREPAR